MTTEYWLQKKTIGGWSHVTWYADKDQALKNFKTAVGNGMSGYSWRLIEAVELEVSMLQEVTEVTLPDNPVIGEAVTITNNTDKPLKVNGWGQQTIVEPKTSWGRLPINIDKDKNISSVPIKPEHGLSGSVWVINHKDRVKKRIKANELDSMLAQGYEKAGPRTEFKT